MSDENSIDPLIPFRDALRQIGVKSATTGYDMVEKGLLPEPLTRGKRRYLLASDVAKHIEAVAATRKAA